MLKGWGSFIMRTAIFPDQGRVSLMRASELTDRLLSDGLSARTMVGIPASALTGLPLWS